MLDTWCPHCGKTWQYPEAYSGQSVQCYCGQWLMIPTIEPIIGNRFREDRYGIHDRNWYAAWSWELVRYAFFLGAAFLGVPALFLGPVAIVFAFRGLDSDYSATAWCSLIFGTLCICVMAAWSLFLGYCWYSLHARLG